MPSNECRSTGLYCAIKADSGLRSSATYANWVPRRQITIATKGAQQWRKTVPPVCIHSVMAASFPKSNKTSLILFLLSKGACETGTHEKNGAKKVHQLMPRASNDALGRIDTKV